MSRVLLVAVFGAAGALARFGISNAVGERDWPFSVLAINVTGSFLLGVLVTWGASKLSADLGMALGVGFLGAFTTFSTFTVDTTLLADDGRVPAATAYVVLSLALGIAAAIAGVALGRSLASR